MSIGIIETNTSEQSVPFTGAAGDSQIAQLATGILTPDPERTPKPIQKRVAPVVEDNPGCFGGFIAKVKKLWAKYVTLPLLKRTLCKTDYSDVNGYFGSLKSNEKTSTECDQTKLGDALYCIVTCLTSKDLIQQTEVTQAKDDINALHQNNFTLETIQAALNDQSKKNRPFLPLFSKFSITIKENIATVSHPITNEVLWNIHLKSKIVTPLHPELPSSATPLSDTTTTI